MSAITWRYVTPTGNQGEKAQATVWNMKTTTLTDSSTPHSIILRSWYKVNIIAAHTFKNVECSVKADFFSQRGWVKTRDPLAKNVEWEGKSLSSKKPANNRSLMPIAARNYNKMLFLYSSNKAYVGFCTWCFFLSKMLHFKLFALKYSVAPRQKVIKMLG